MTWRQILSVRLSSILHRARLEGGAPDLQARETVNGFTLQLPSAWLDENPLTAAALHDESAVWEEAGFRLRIRATRK